MVNKIVIYIVNTLSIHYMPIYDFIVKVQSRLFAVPGNSVQLGYYLALKVVKNAWAHDQGFPWGPNKAIGASPSLRWKMLGHMIRGFPWGPNKAIGVSPSPLLESFVTPLRRFCMGPGSLRGFAMPLGVFYRSFTSQTAFDFISLLVLNVFKRIKHLKHTKWKFNYVSRKGDECSCWNLVNKGFVIF